MTKLEHIQKAYGEHWDIVKDHVSENGWISVNALLEKKFPLMKHIKCEPDDWEDICAYRPIVLNGLENNNGWITLKEDGSNIPTENTLYDLVQFDKDGFLREETLEILKILFNSKTITHYKKSQIIKPPLYYDKT